MRANDEVTKDHIEFLEDHCLNLEVEVEELKQTIKSLLVRLQYMAADPTVEM